MFYKQNMKDVRNGSAIEHALIELDAKCKEFKQKIKNNKVYDEDRVRMVGVLIEAHNYWKYLEFMFMKTTGCLSVNNQVFSASDGQTYTASVALDTMMPAIRPDSKHKSDDHIRKMMHAISTNDVTEQSLLRRARLCIADPKFAVDVYNALHEARPKLNFYSNFRIRNVTVGSIGYTIHKPDDMLCADGIEAYSFKVTFPLIEKFYEMNREAGYSTNRINWIKLDFVVACLSRAKTICMIANKLLHTSCMLMLPVRLRTTFHPAYKRLSSEIQWYVGSQPNRASAIYNDRFSECPKGFEEYITAGPQYGFLHVVKLTPFPRYNKNLRITKRWRRAQQYFKNWSDGLVDYARSEAEGAT